jgi:hypothetical protein
VVPRRKPAKTGTAPQKAQPEYLLQPTPPLLRTPFISTLCAVFRAQNDPVPPTSYTVSFRAPIEPAIRGVMKPLRSGVFGVSDRSLFTSF